MKTSTVAVTLPVGLIAGVLILSSTTHVHGSESWDVSTCTQTTVPQNSTAPATEGTPPPPTDCWDLRDTYNISQDGVYPVLSPRGMRECVLCDMKTDGGGWTIFHKRYKSNVAFNRSYEEFKVGFGDLKTDFWMGNELLHQYTAIKTQTLRVDLCHRVRIPKYWYAMYDEFSVGTDKDCFRLQVAGFHGNASDALKPTVNGLENHNGKCFSTYDKDIDTDIHLNCAALYESGWWFHRCFDANLNYAVAGYWDEILLSSQMKFRPRSAAEVYSTDTALKCPDQ